MNTTAVRQQTTKQWYTPGEATHAVEAKISEDNADIEGRQCQQPVNLAVLHLHSR